LDLWHRASEHITNNINILEDYTENKTTMKCEYNTLCYFKGYGTYHGIINNHKFTLNKYIIQQATIRI